MASKHEDKSRFIEGRFAAEADALANRFTASIPFDRRLYRQDIEGSMAHADMLARQGIISAEDRDAIVAGLDEIRREIERGDFEFRLELEDIHMNVENRLHEKIGPAAGRLHTARSRNDQVLVDFRMFVREAIDTTLALLEELRRTLVDAADGYVEVIIPGFTHTQHAQPLSLGHHFMAHYEMFSRDRERFAQARARTNLNPLGAGALAGTPWPIDRRATAEALGFDGVTANSLDTISDRDFVLDFMSAASICLVHASRLAEELVLWSSAEFGFAELSDAHATGSSIMPQKKNPDTAELCRGKAARVFGHLTAMLATMKATPLGYNTDFQEDKESTFDTVDTLHAVLAVLTGCIAGLTVHEDACARAVGRGFITATDAADYLARKGMTFREAHTVVGRLVRRCLDLDIDLADLPLEEFRQFSALFEEDIHAVLTPRGSVESRTSEGGTAMVNVREAIHRAREEWQ